MIFDRFPRAIRECLAGFEALRRLKFKSDDIYFHHDGWQVAICVHLKDKEFSIGCGRLPPGVDPEKVWREACDVWQSAATPEADRQMLYRGSSILQYGVELVAALRDRGMLDSLADTAGGAPPN